MVMIVMMTMASTLYGGGGDGDRDGDDDCDDDCDGGGS